MNKQIQEMLPLVNEKDEILGSVTREEAHDKAKPIHRSAIVLIFRRKRILLQKRSASQDVYPNCWAESVGGHVKYGETYEASALREIKEEIGLQVKKNEVIPLTKLYITTVWERTFAQIYLLNLTNDMRITINKNEVTEVKFVPITDLRSMLLDRNIPWDPFARKSLTACLSFIQ